MAHLASSSSSSSSPSSELLSQPISNFDVARLVGAHLQELKGSIKTFGASEAGLLGPVELEERVLKALRGSAIETETAWSMGRIRDMLREHELTPLERLHLLNFLPSSEVQLHLLLDHSSPYNTEEDRPALLHKIAALRLYDPDRPGRDDDDDDQAIEQQQQQQQQQQMIESSLSHF